MSSERADPFAAVVLQFDTGAFYLLTGRAFVSNERTYVEVDATNTFDISQAMWVAALERDADPEFLSDVVDAAPKRVVETPPRNDGIPDQTDLEFGLAGTTEEARRAIRSALVGLDGLYARQAELVDRARQVEDSEPIRRARLHEIDGRFVAEDADGRLHDVTWTARPLLAQLVEGTPLTADNRNVPLMPGAYYITPANYPQVERDYSGPAPFTAMPRLMMNRIPAPTEDLLDFAEHDPPDLSMEYLDRSVRPDGFADSQITAGEIPDRDRLLANAGVGWFAGADDVSVVRDRESDTATSLTDVIVVKTFPDEVAVMRAVERDGVWIDARDVGAFVSDLEADQHVAMMPGGGMLSVRYVSTQEWVGMGPRVGIDAHGVPREQDGPVVDFDRARAIIESRRGRGDDEGLQQRDDPPRRPSPGDAAAGRRGEGRRGPVAHRGGRGRESGERLPRLTPREPGERATRSDTPDATLQRPVGPA